MKQNQVLAARAAGRPALNGWITFAAQFSAEIMVRAGWDCATFDLQHGALSADQACDLIAALAGSPVTLMVRVPQLDPGLIARVLDAGAQGIVCPMVESREAAQQLVRAVRYPPLGCRSFGPARAQLLLGQDYAAQANAQVCVLAMIETARGVQHAPDIVSVEGLDGTYVGPSDLGLSLGLPPELESDAPSLVQARDCVLRATHARGRIAGIHCATPRRARQMAELGFDLVTLSADAKLLAEAAGRAVAAFRAPD